MRVRSLSNLHLIVRSVAHIQSCSIHLLASAGNLATKFALGWKMSKTHSKLLNPVVGYCWLLQQPSANHHSSPWNPSGSLPNWTILGWLPNLPCSPINDSKVDNATCIVICVALRNHISKRLLWSLLATNTVFQDIRHLAIRMWMLRCVQKNQTVC